MRAEPFEYFPNTDYETEYSGRIQIQRLVELRGIEPLTS